MAARVIIAYYLALLIVVGGLYIYTVQLSLNPAIPTRYLQDAIPVFMDLIKVIVGGAIGSFAALLGRAQG